MNIVIALRFHCEYGVRFRSKFSYYLYFAVIMIREDEFSHRLNKNANFCGFTPLHYACLIDSYEGVKLLLQRGITLV